MWKQYREKLTLVICTVGSAMETVKDEGIFELTTAWKNTTNRAYDGKGVLKTNGIISWQNLSDSYEVGQR